MQSNNVNQGAVALTIGSVPRRTVFELRQFDCLFIFNNQWKLRNSGTILRGTNPTVSATAPRILAPMQLGGPMALTLHLHDTQIIARQNRHFLRSLTPPPRTSVDKATRDKWSVTFLLSSSRQMISAPGSRWRRCRFDLPRSAALSSLRTAGAADFADADSDTLWWWWSSASERCDAGTVPGSERARRTRHRDESGATGNDVGGTHNKTAFKRCCITLAVVGYIEFEEKTKLNNFHGH